MSRTVVITGATGGIGLELCKRYLDHGDHVIAIVRKATDELTELGTTVIEGIDLIDASSVDQVKEKLNSKTIDILINNAGLFENESLPLSEDDFESIRKQFEINTLAPLRLTNALIENFTTDSKVAMMSSRMGSIADNSSSNYYGYRMSKCALNMASKNLSIELKGKGVSLAILHPGFVITKMTNFQGDITPEVASWGLFKVIQNLTLENTGGFWHSNGETLPF
ncbi:short-chain dehydrogenase [Halobacteriovorax marinus]|uniref:Short-chain dehydrogenase n=1 Tax=Halobacteriovorax marinus TaxID=97084 RepID=A0A1Y5F6Z0_9BACT|nr:short-chain dehydrogenase [Halobacteriovorax marinus]